MKEKLAAMLLAVVMTVGLLLLSACSGEAETPSTDSPETPKQSDTQETTETPATSETPEISDIPKISAPGDLEDTGCFGHPGANTHAHTDANTHAHTDAHAYADTQAHPEAKPADRAEIQWLPAPAKTT